MAQNPQKLEQELVPQSSASSFGYTQSYPCCSWSYTCFIYCYAGCSCCSCCSYYSYYSCSSCYFDFHTFDWMYFPQEFLDTRQTLEPQLQFGQLYTYQYILCLKRRDSCMLGSNQMILLQLSHLCLICHRHIALFLVILTDLGRQRCHSRLGFFLHLCQEGFHKFDPLLGKRHKGLF